MQLSQLTIQNLRCLDQVSIELAPHLNIFLGDNGAGKTSLLEAVYVLSRGQSFRSSQTGRLIKHGSDSCLVRALQILDQQQTRNLAIRKSLDTTELRLGSEKAVRMSDIARACPVLILEPGQHRLVEDGPNLRRRFLDWSVFHVEHGYHGVWQRFSRALKQRNAILRSRQFSSLEAWTYEYVTAAEQLETLRSATFLALLPYIKKYLDQFLALDLEFSYRRGWNKEQSLTELLSAQQLQDKERGFTNSGPHRAEIRVGVNGQSARDILSRGQQKLLITAMMLGQAQHFLESLGLSPILLVDDLASELGSEAREKLFKVLRDYPGQCLITALESEALPKALCDSAKMFHVKHGAIQAVV